MPKYALKFDIECGEKTCASEPGKFCLYCTIGAFGGATCFFYGKLGESDGWVSRHPECLKNAGIINEQET